MSLTDKCKPSTKHAAVKRQGNFIAHVHHHGNHHHGHGVTSTSNKRRRHNPKEEIEYAAASIQSALSNAGRWPLVSRRERALPVGSVDRDGAKVITSREFDAQDGADGEEDCPRDDKDKKMKKKKNSSGGATTCTSNADDYNLLSMYMIADLIQSTQNYYCFSSDDYTNNTNSRTTQKANDDATVVDTSTRIFNGNSPPITMNQTIGDVHYDEKSSEDNSEGLSSWAPSSSSSRRHFNYCDKKAIDNDNRSDDQSIDMAKEESSSSSLDSLASNDGVIECKNYDGPYSVIG